MNFETASKILWGFLILFSLVVIHSLWTFFSPERFKKRAFLTPNPFADFVISLLAIWLIWWKFRSVLFIGGSP